MLACCSWLLFLAAVLGWLFLCISGPFSLPWTFGFLQLKPNSVSQDNFRFLTFRFLTFRFLTFHVFLRYTFSYATRFLTSHVFLRYTFSYVVSPRRTPCISVGTARLLYFVSASFSNSFKTESSLLNSALLQYRSPTLGPLCLEYLSNHFQINFWVTSTLATINFSLVPFLRYVSPLRLSSCFSWSRWSICFPCG